MRFFWIALRFLTLFPWPRNLRLAPADVGSSTPFFPAVGFFLGLLLILANQFLEPYLESEILGVALVVVLVLAAGGRHLRGLGATFDEMGLRSGEQDVKGGYLGVFGLLAVLVVITLKFRSIEVMGEVRSQGLLLAPVLGRWSMVILAYGSRPKWEGEGEMAGRVKGLHIFWATTLALLLVIIFSGQLGLWIALWVSLLTLLSGWYFHRSQSGVGGNNLDAVVEMAEALAMVLFASLY